MFTSSIKLRKITLNKERWCGFIITCCSRIAQLFTIKEGSPNTYVCGVLVSLQYNNFFFMIMMTTNFCRLCVMILGQRRRHIHLVFVTVLGRTLPTFFAKLHKKNFGVSWNVLNTIIYTSRRHEQYYNIIYTTFITMWYSSTCGLWTRTANFYSVYSMKLSMVHVVPQYLWNISLYRLW